MRRACWHFCVCARPCVCVSVWDGRLWSVLLIGETASKPEPALRKTLTRDEGRFLKLICPLYASLHHSKQIQTQTDTQWHTQSSSVSNESPEDLSDNNSTHICFFSNPGPPPWSNAPITLDHVTAFQSVSSLSIPIQSHSCLIVIVMNEWHISQWPLFVWKAALISHRYLMWC